jgi:hypothetical protein
MLAEMTASEFAGWRAFFSLEPWGFHEENRRMAVLASTISNMSGKIVRRPVTPDAFMPVERHQPTSVIDKVKAAFGYGKGKG